MTLACERTMTISEWRKHIKLREIYQELEEIIKLLSIKEIDLGGEIYEDVHDHIVVSSKYIRYENGKWIYTSYSSGGGWADRHTSKWTFDSLFDAVNRWHQPERMILVVLRCIRKKLEEREGK